MSRFAKLLTAVGATLCFTGALHGTGYYGPNIYLEQGGANVDASPEFYWGLEVRRLAQEFHPTEKLVVPETCVYCNPQISTKTLMILLSMKPPQA